jgi:ferrochelatase
VSVSRRPGVLLMTYGSPSAVDRESVRAYLGRVRGGRAPSDELVTEFTRRYEVIGGSPLIGITRDLAAALADRLGWPVAVGMRFSDPSIADGLRELADRDVTDVAAIVLSPQFSPLLMGGYRRAIEEAQSAIGPSAPGVVTAGPWHQEPAFVQALARRAQEALGELARDGFAAPAVLMTAHSLPREVAEREPDYLDQLRATASGVAAGAGLGPDAWQFAWQSAGHEPGEWMKPDFADLMPQIAADSRGAVLIVPIQFLADHLEVLYDVDIGAREQAERHGLTFRRVASLNADPGLVTALAAVAEQLLAATAAPR